MDNVGVLRADGAKNAVNVGVLSHQRSLRCNLELKEIETILGRASGKTDHQDVVDSDDE